MKKYTREEFNNLTKEELIDIPNDEYRNIPSHVKRSCSGCGFMTSALSHWCTNKDAIEARGTTLPGIIKCDYWKDKKSFSFKNLFKLIFIFLKPIREK